MTARDFFTQVVPHRLADGRAGPLRGSVRFEIDGPGGGAWVVDFDGKTVTSGAGVARSSVRAAERDFMAVVEGRMSISDGMVTDRLQVAGEVTALLNLGETLETWRERER
jgi:hypothetical protein